MDARAGGLTEVSTVVSDPKLLRDAGQQKTSATTDKYLRDQSASANTVIKCGDRSGENGPETKRSHF
jgi:hypothetical protein